MNRTTDSPHPGWKTTKRVLDWESVIPSLREKEVEPRPMDDESEEEPTCRVLQEEKSMGVSPCSSNPPGPETREYCPEPQTPLGRPASDVRLNGNPAAPGHPGDLKNCDLAAMGDKLLGVLYAADDWIDPSWEEVAPARSVGILDGNQQRVEKWWEEKAPKSVHPRLEPFLKNMLARAEPDQTEDTVLRKALETLSEEGSTKHAEEAVRVLKEMEGTAEVGKSFPVHQRDGGAAAVSWGTVFMTDEYQSDELFVGNLAFTCIDFGENLKLSTILQKKLVAGEEIEQKKCTVLALAAGAEWVAQGRPKRFPARRRIDVLASSLRLGEFLNAEQAWEQAVDEPSEVAKEIRSICHDALTAGHERDYQALGMFLLPALWKCVAVEVVVVEIQSWGVAVFHTYPACPVSNDTVIFPIAHQGHMMWGKPTSATSTVTWEKWRENLNVPGSEVAHQVAPWKYRLEHPDAIESGGKPIPLKPCPHCQLMIKVGLTNLTVGTTYPHTYPAAATSSQDPDRWVYPPPTLVGPVPGMAEAASPGAHKRYSVIPTSTSFPVKTIKWKAGLVCLIEGAQYVATCRRMGEFPVENMQEVMDAGSKLAQAAGGMVKAARQVRFLRFRELRYAREFIEKTQHLYPEAAEEVMSIFTIGAAPKYDALPAKTVPGDGYPHNAAHTRKILESMWGDMRQLKVILCATTSLTFGERLEYSPTTTVPKRLPDRTFSSKSRIISDLRRINLGINTDDFFPIWLPDVKDITERIVRKKRQYPGYPIKLCKRDISNAFKRVPLHPDYIAIFCNQFERGASGLSHDATIGWLALPFGFSASPAIFAMCTDVIQRVHYSGRPSDGSWSGWGEFWSVIFVDDAIFSEAETQNVSNETVAAWETSCRSLFGPDSINDDKVRLEGQWGTSGLILGFDIDTVKGTIAAPLRKWRVRERTCSGRISLLVANT